MLAYSFPLHAFPFVQVQETERLQADAAAWAALPAEQQRERATALQQAQGQLKVRAVCVARPQVLLCFVVILLVSIAGSTWA